MKEEYPFSTMMNTEIRLYWYSIVNAYMKGACALPHQLGLPEDKYHTLVTYFQTIELVNSEDDCCVEDKSIECKRTIYDELLTFRLEERDAVVNLLLAHADESLPQYEAMAFILATASLGSNHLWQDLGLPDRALLNSLIEAYFPSLHARNTQSMRWKRFIYKQLCDQGGDYVCRAPSCDTCSSFSECFAPEE